HGMPSKWMVAVGARLAPARKTRAATSSFAAATGSLPRRGLTDNLTMTPDPFDPIFHPQGVLASTTWLASSLTHALLWGSSVPLASGSLGGILRGGLNLFQFLAPLAGLVRLVGRFVEPHQPL